MCCGGGCYRGVAYYVEGANVVKKWEGRDCDNWGYQGRQDWVFKLLRQTLYEAKPHEPDREAKSLESETGARYTQARTAKGQLCSFAVFAYICRKRGPNWGALRWCHTGC